MASSTASILSPGASVVPGPGSSPRPRASLKRVLFLVDGRHGLKHTDATFLQQLFVAPQDSGNENNKDSNGSNGGNDDNHSNNGSNGNHGMLTNDDGDSNNSVIGMTKHHPSIKHSSLFPKWKLQIVLTKCDLVERNDLARRMAAVHGQLR